MSDRNHRPILGALAVAAAAVVLAGMFVWVRVSAVGFDGFVGAGAVTADGSSVFTYDHYGYDGQFFYRLAVEPFSTAERVDGIAFDAPAYRQQRIGYPLLAHVLALTPLTTVQAMVLVNVGAVGVLAFFAARIAQHGGRSPAWGLLILTWPAFIFALGLDLAEIVAAALALGGVLFALHNRHELAAAAMTGAVLTRETTVLLAVVALFAYRKWAYAWTIGALVVWEVLVIAMWGAVPGLTSRPTPGGTLIGLPFVGWLAGAGRWGILDLASVVALVVVVWIGGQHLRSKTLPSAAFAAYVLLAVCLGTQVAESWRGFTRASVELALMAYVLRVTNTDVPTATEPPPPVSAPA